MFINSNYIILDIENNTSNQFKRKAGNFLYDPIIAVGICKNKDPISIYIYPNKFDFFEIKEDLLVIHNSQHDLLFLWQYKWFQDFFKRGGKIWDTAIAEYYLTSFQTSLKQKEQISLRYLAVNKYGCKEREKQMENYWEQGLQTSQIPEEIVLNDVENDVLDTEAIFLQQYEECKSRGILEVIELQMEARLATLEMEYEGFQIDKELLDKKTLDLDEEEIYNKNEFYNLISDFIEPIDYQEKPKIMLHALLFGGQVKKVRKIPELDMAGIPKVLKSGDNKGQVKLKNEEYLETIAGLGIPILDSWKTEKGNVSVDERVLKEIVELYKDRPSKKIVVDICDNLLKQRTLEKDLSTYHIGIQTLLYPDNRLRCKFNHNTTGTGRSSSDSLNMQNIPKEPSTIKAVFISRY